MTGLDDENRELEDFLARRSVLHRRLANRDRHEPSQELDRLVLDKAREAIDVRGSAPMYRAPRWALPVGLAASIVLALAIVVNFTRMHDGRDGGGYPVAASASPAADAAPGFAEREVLPMAPSPPPVELAKQSTQAFAPALRTDSADAESPPLQAAGEPGRASDAQVTSNAAKPAPNAKRVSPPAPTAANSPRFARAEVPAERRVVPARDSALREAGAATSAASAPVLSDKAKHPDPQVWMREIEQLRLAGKSADADREITAFRKAFPSLPVSPTALGRDLRPTK
jgi:hypothetical protein